MIKLRPANKKDKKFFLNCYNQKDSRNQMESDHVLHHLWYKDIISRPTSLWFIIEKDKKKVGLFNTFWRGEDYQWGVIIAKKHRRKGYAREAIKKILTITDNKKQDTFIQCFNDNPAKKLYEELGYKEVAGAIQIRDRKFIRMFRKSC
jgi:RimJ/RimL family protein N-acetyltransferase